MDDPLKKLLDQTGWTYEDVLKRLEQYKQTNVIKTSEKNNDCDNSITNNAQETKATDHKEDGIDSKQTVDTASQELTTAHNRRKRKSSEDEYQITRDKDSHYKQNIISCASNNEDITETCDGKMESFQDGESIKCKRIKVSSSNQSDDGTKVDGGEDLDGSVKDNAITSNNDSECSESSNCKRTTLFCSTPKNANNIEMHKIHEITNCKVIDISTTTSADDNECVSEDSECFECNNVSISSSTYQTDDDKKMKSVQNKTNICVESSAIASNNESSHSVDLILEKSDSSVATNTSDTTNSDYRCVTGGNQSLDNKQNKLSCKNPSSNKIICKAEVNARLESEKSNEVIKTFQQIKMKNMELNECCQPVDDTETTLKCEENDRLTGIDVTKEKVDIRGENNNNNPSSTITKRRNSRRKSNLKHDIENKLFHETTIQDNICDNSYSTNSSMENLTQSLNKRRKLSETINLDTDSECSSVTEEATKVVNTKGCDNTSYRSETLEPVDINLKETFTNKSASDEIDSNKENANLNFNCEERTICDKDENPSDQNLDTSSTSYSSIIREDTFFNEAKSRYFHATKVKNKEPTDSKLEVSDNIENINLNDGQEIPDFIEMLKQEVCNRFSAQAPIDKCKESVEERSTANDLEQPNTNNGDNQKTNSDASNFRVGIGNITSMISKKLESSCSTEDEAEKARSHESGSTSSSSCDQDNKPPKHRRQHQILILKRKSDNNYQSNLKTFVSTSGNSGETICSNATITSTHASNGASIFSNTTITSTPASSGTSISSNSTVTSTPVNSGASISSNATITSTPANSRTSIASNATITSTPVNSGASISSNATITSTPANSGTSISSNATITSTSLKSGTSISSNATIRPTSLLAKKHMRKFNTDRLTNITNILSQKLSIINKELDAKEAANDELNLKIVDVVGGYKSPSPELESAHSWSFTKSYVEKKRSLKEDIQVTQSKTKVDEPTTSKRWKTALPTNESSMQPPKTDTSAPLQTQTNENPIKPTKTKDVTKIKGWKKKKFAIESPVIKEKVETNDSTISLSSILAGPSTAPPVSSRNLETQSVFTSSILEEFLSENANLNISYEVPTLEAERTLQQTYTDIKFPKHEGQKEVSKPDINREKKEKKPKTVAEKRKLEERLPFRILEDLLLQFETPPKHYTTMILKLKHKMLVQNSPFSRKAFLGASKITNTESFVIYNNKKISVSSAKSNKVFCKIVHKEGITQIKKPRKLSLLQSLAQQELYNPNDWEKVEKMLPKVYLEFIPTIGKRLHPKISHLIESNETILNRQRVNFALSVLKTTEAAPPKRFLFRVPFQNNQRTVILRKRIVDEVFDDVTIEKVEIEESVDDAVRNVMNKILDYVDVLDETKDIVLEDDAYDVVPSTQVQTKTDKKIDKLTAMKEFKRTAFEMRRLNCKFVSISPADEAEMNKPCEKDHCRLGCVCNSIEGSVNNLLETHCGLYKCMFRCTCKREIINHSNTVHEGIINRLQDEATKNLAKVEKEFTQTIIQTNNQLIVVGDSSERKRRVARAPKKYDDFVEENFYCEEIPKVIVPPPPVKSPKIIYKNFIFEKCFVKLFKYDFKNIIPFCWVHLLYKCQCVIETVPVHRPIPKAAEIPMSPIDRQVKLKKTASFDKLSTPSDRETKSTSSDKDDHTSRTRGIPSNYYSFRNKTHKHLTRIQKSTKLLESMLHLYLKDNADDILSTFENDKLNSQPPNKLRVSKNNFNVDEDSNGSEINIVHSKETERELILSSQNTKRKKELKIQRRRVKKAAKGKKLSQKCDSPPENHTTQVQQSEKEFCMFLSKHNSQVRILPWSVLISRYESGSFQLWTINSPNAPVLLTENGKRPTINHYNLKLFEHLSGPFNPSCDIIRYIIKKETPLGKTKDQVWVLFLEISKNVWKILGMCEKNESSKQNFSISILSLYGRLEDIIKESNEQCQEKVIVDANKTITSSKRHYLPKKLIPIAVPKNEKIEHSLWGSVPNITSNCKWRVVSLKIPFAHLSFSRCNYTIEFNDILKAMELTQSSGLTLALRSDDLHMTYTHAKFGIYCDHLHPDKIFVGPYFDCEHCDLTFLVSKGDGLVDSARTKDGTIIGSSFWYQQATPVEDQVEDDVQFIPDETSSLIDLTNDSDNEQITNTSVVDIESTKTNVSDTDLDSKRKRYIITNVASVGYISATVDLITNYLDIICPITLKVKTFLDASAAIETLQRILIRKFILVPLTFKLKVKMVTKINSKKYKPLNSSILNGYHMVGAFGVKNASTVTFQDLSKYGLTNAEIMQVIEQRERKLLLLPLSVLSKLLNVYIPNKAPFLSSLQAIASAAQEEVNRLHADEAKYIDQTFHLHNKKKALAKRCLLLVGNLPAEQRTEEKNRLTTILKSYTPRVNKVLYETNKLLKPVRNDVDDPENVTELRNLFDEPTVKKTNDDMLSSTSFTSEIKLPASRSILTRKPSKPRSSTKANEEEQTPTSITKVTSPSSIVTPLSDVGKNLKLINNTILMQKSTTSLLKPVEKKYLPSAVLNQILNTLPGTANATSTTSTPTQIPKLPPVIKVPQNVTPTTSGYTVVTLPSTGTIGTVKIGKSTYLAHTNQHTTPNCTKSSETSNNSMATLTPLLQSNLKNNATSTKKPNYIAVQHGDNMRYFKLSQKTSLKNQSAIQSIPSSAKKIILSNVATNADQKTGK